MLKLGKYKSKKDQSEIKILYIGQNCSFYKSIITDVEFADSNIYLEQNYVESIEEIPIYKYYFLSGDIITEWIGSEKRFQMRKISGLTGTLLKKEFLLNMSNVNNSNYY